MIAFIVIVIVACLGLIAMLGALVLFPYLCAVATGRAVGWMLQVEPAPQAQDVKELLSTECWAARDDPVAGSQRLG